MDVTGIGGRLLYTEVRIAGFEPQCTVEDPVKGGMTVTTETLKVTASDPGAAVFTPVNANGEFATIHIVSTAGNSCSIAGAYVVKGATLTGSVTADVLTVNSTTELKVNKKAASLTGAATITAGVTGGTYHPVELKSS